MLLRRLSVFAGGWSLEAAEAICAGDGIDVLEILDMQSHLVDKSLVMIEEGTGDDMRYRLLGTIRQYARDRLVESGEAAAVRSRHLEWFVGVAERAAPELRGTDQVLWLNRLEQEHDNFRAALEWSLSVEGGAEAGMRLSGALYRFWYRRGYLTEGFQWLESALSAGRAPANARARALHGAGYLAWGQGDRTRARALLAESLALYRDLGDKRGLARTLNSFGIIAEEDGNPDEAQRLYEEGLSLAREINAQDLVVSLLNNLGENARVQSDYSRARSLYEEALALRLGANTGTVIAYVNLGLVAFVQGDHPAARTFFRHSLEIAVKIGDKTSVPLALEGLAGVHGVQGHPRRAARLLGWADALRKAINLPVQSGDRADYDSFVSAARGALADAAFTAAWNEGAAMTLEQAVEHALEDVPAAIEEGATRDD
jgi:non-specific serine/threonine protein kinase